MHGGAPAPWHERPVDEALRVHDHYIRTVPDRIDRFGDLMKEAGFALDSLDWSTLDAFDDLWFWAHDHFSILSDRTARVQRGFIDPWTPYIPGCVLRPDWPSFNEHPDLTIEAQEFASGLAALLADFAIEHWDARWIFGDRLPLEPALRLRSLLEIPRDPANPAASFGPVRVSPEQLMAHGLRRHHPDPLWVGPPEWHRLHDRIRGPFKDWTLLFSDQAEELHDYYVGGHLRRLSEFREWLLHRGLDTRAMAFDSVEDLELIWAWSQANVEFDEQVRSPRGEWRSWYPALSQGAEPDFAFPRWDDVHLSANTLTFASGLAACATEVALRSWGADWHLGGRRGDLRAVNRTHLYVKGAQGRPETWVDIEREIAVWLSEAVLRTRRTLPGPTIRRRVVGDTETIAQFRALFEVPSAPWLRWRARFEPRLLPGDRPTQAFSTAITTERTSESTTVEPLVPILSDTATEEPEPGVETVEVTTPPNIHQPPEPVTAASSTRPIAEPEPQSRPPEPSPVSDDADPACAEPAPSYTPAALPFAAEARSEIAARLAAVITLERATQGLEPAVEDPSPAERAVGRGSFDDAAAWELRIEPDDDAGERDWRIDVGGPGARVDVDLVDRFARRLNRTKGVMKARQSEHDQVQLRVGRSGPADVDGVESLVQRVWARTKATHRGPALAGSTGST